MDVLLGRLRGVRSKLQRVGRLLVIKFDQDHWTVHAVIKRAVRLRATDPSEPSLVEVAVHLVHLHAGVAFVEVNQIAEALSSGTWQIVRAQSRIIATLSLNASVGLLLPVFEKLRMACFRSASGSAFNMARPSFCSQLRLHQGSSLRHPDPRDALCCKTCYCQPLEVELCTQLQHSAIAAG